MAIDAVLFAYDWDVVCRVVDTDGRPIEGVELNLAPYHVVGYEGNSATPAGHIRNGETDASGVCSFLDVHSGSLALAELTFASEERTVGYSSVELLYTDAENGVTEHTFVIREAISGFKLWLDWSNAGPENAAAMTYLSHRIQLVNDQGAIVKDVETANKFKNGQRIAGDYSGSYTIKVVTRMYSFSRKVEIFEGQKEVRIFVPKMQSSAFKLTDDAGNAIEASFFADYYGATKVWACPAPETWADVK